MNEQTMKKYEKVWREEFVSESKKEALEYAQERPTRYTRYAMLTHEHRGWVVWTRWKDGDGCYDIDHPRTRGGYVDGGCSVEEGEC